jgi:anaerobic selenocysteine-containing dehydrogenase
MTTHRSVCPYDCPDTCGLLVEVENDRAVKVTGDPEHPMTRGLLCPKMLHYEKTIHSPRRLTMPLRRMGAKGEGAFEPISWDEAIVHICSQWRRLIAEHGAESILPYSYAGTMGLVQRNAGHAFFHKLGASRLERTICSPAKDAGWKTLMGDTPAMYPDEMSSSDLVVLWGINAAATSIHAMRDARQARRNGARLWVIDTYRTPTAEAADRVILVKPGGDGALALGMMHVMVREGYADRDFIGANVLGFDRFEREVLSDSTPEKMSEVCGVPTETIALLAREYALSQRPFIRLGSGLTRYGNGAMTVRTICCLPAVSGAWRHPGGGIFCGTSTGGAFPMAAITREDFMAQPTRIISMNRLGEALNFGIHSAGRISDAEASGKEGAPEAYEPVRRGAPDEADELMRLKAGPPIMSLYVYHSNPASIAPDQNAVIRGLEREDLFTVVHERFLTDTARYADIVLPATSSLEHADLYRCYGGYHAQRCNAVIPAVSGSKNNWEVFSLLARKMEWSEPFFHLSADELIEILISEENLWRTPEINKRLRRGEPVLMTPPSPPRFDWKTPSGKIEILNEREPEALPRLLPTHAVQDGFPLRLQPATTPQALNSSFYEQDDLRQKQECMALMMNPVDAEQRYMVDGQQVLAFNQLGEVGFTLRITDRVPAGTVVTEGVWWSEFIGGKRGVNALTSQRLTDGGSGSTLYDVTVEVRKLQPSTKF